MISRRYLLSRLTMVAAGGAMLWAIRDRLPWPPAEVAFESGERSGWIPLTNRGSMIEIPGTVNGVPIRVVVDSGAQMTAIDRGLAQRLQLPQTAGALPLLAFGVTGAPTISHTVKLQLGLPGLAVSDLRAAVLDLEGLGKLTGRPFSMLLGRDVLRHLALEIDYPRRRVAFHRTGGQAPTLDAITLPLKVVGGAPTLQVRVDGSDPINVLVDTGASTSLALSQDAARKAGLLAPGRASTTAHSISLGGLSLDQVVVAQTVDVGGLTLRETPVQIYVPAARGKAPDGLLGAGLLRRYLTVLDLGAGQLFLVPQTPTIATGVEVGRVRPRP